MSIARRLTQSFGSSLFGPAVTVFIQFINIPIMLRKWGPELFGEWLILSAIPSYLLLSDMGFGNVAGSDMTMRVSAGDLDGARETFQSTMALVLASTLVLGAVAGVLLYTLPIHHLLHLRAIPSLQARFTLMLLSLNCLVLLQWSVLMAAYRSTGHYAAGMVYVNCIRIVEGAGVFLVLFAQVGPQQLAAYMLAVSVAGTFWLAFHQRRAEPWIAMGFHDARWARIRELSRPAFAYMAFPACAAMSTQGMTLVVGLTLGPLAVAVFNPMRTLSRVALQLTDAVKNSVWPELSAAFGRNDLALARRLHRGGFQTSLLLATAALAILAFTGQHIFSFWTHYQVSMDVPAFRLLLLVVLANSIWNVSSSVALSINRHEQMALRYFTFSFIAILLAAMLAHPLGLRGIALGMLFADISMAIFVLRTSTRLLNDPGRDFLNACLHPAEIRSLLARLRD